MTKVQHLDKHRHMFFLNILVKVVLFVSFFIALTFDLQQLQGKAMPLRAPFFLSAALLLPLLSYVRKWESYPHTADILIVLPIVLDTMGNLFGFFDTRVLFDDVLHAFNWMFLVMAFHALRFHKIQDNRDALLLGMSMGAMLILLWEGIEWLVSPSALGLASNLSLTYDDTVGDLLTSFLGGVVGSLAGVYLFGRETR